jgi:hypothetical protein
MVRIDAWCPWQESNPHQPLRTGLFYPLNYKGNTARTGRAATVARGNLEAKKAAELLLVVADDNVLTDGDDRNAHLAGLLDHLLPLFHI